MGGTAIILGARGRFGRAATAAFLAAGWRVRTFARSAGNAAAPAGVETVTGDAFEAAAVARAAAGCDVIVNGLNPPYPRWAADLPLLTASVLTAARTTGATIMFPGNVYVYGADMPAVLTESTPHAPTTRKGRLRVEMEEAHARAAAEGVRTVILRAGDFYERARTGNWFDSHIAHAANKGRITYPGPLDCVHAWAYLPDMARAMVGLAEKRGDFDSFEEFGFPGHALTGAELVAAIERVTGRAMTVKSFPWPVIRLLGLAWPMMREVVEMRYLWDTPHAIDGSKLAAALPDFRATPVDTAIADALGVAADGTVPAGAALPSHSGDGAVQAS